MTTFKVGDRVRRIKDSYFDMKPGDTDTITSVRIKTPTLELKKHGTGHSSYNFELVEPTLQELIDEKEALLVKIEAELAEARALLAAPKPGDRYKFPEGVYLVRHVIDDKAWCVSPSGYECVMKNTLLGAKHVVKLS